MPQFRKQPLTYVFSFFVFFFPVVKYFSLFHLLLLLWLRGCRHQLRFRGGGRGCGLHPGHCTHTGTLQQVDSRYLIEPGLKNNIIIYILLMSQQVHVMYKYLNGFINPQKRANDDENVWSVVCTKEEWIWTMKRRVHYLLNHPFRKVLLIYVLYLIKHFNQTEYFYELCNEDNENNTMQQYI